MTDTAARLRAQIESYESIDAGLSFPLVEAADEIETLLSELSRTAALAEASTAKFDAVKMRQESLAIQFCEEIAGKRGQRPSHPDPVRLLEMAEALYLAEITPDAGKERT